MPDEPGLEGRKIRFTRPVLLIPGLYAGFVFGLTLILTYFSTLFIATRILILLSVLFPLFVAGTLGSLKDECVSVKQYLLYAKQYYFPVLLPALLILFISILILMATVSTVAITGEINPVSAFFAAIGSFFVCCMLYSMLFYDVIAVLENKKVLESIKESYRLVFRRPLPVLAMVVILALMGIAIGLICIVLFSFALADVFSPYIGMDAKEIENTFSSMSASDWEDFLGLNGFAVLSVIGAFGSFLFITIFYSYRYRWYKILTIQGGLFESDMKKSSPASLEGEYDDKGRWYKYK